MCFLEIRNLSYEKQQRFIDLDLYFYILFKNSEIC